MRQPPDAVPESPRRRWRWSAVALAFTVSALLGWSFLWPVEPCDDPRCAARRFTVAIEIDALGHVAPIDFEVSSGAGTLSLQAILRGGGIEVRLAQDELGLPYDPSSGPLDRADLYQLVSAWRSRVVADADANLYALFTTALIADNGEPLFGIMFDTAGREGFAVAPRTTERFFEAQEPASVGVLQLRTFAHELLHALNRHHADAARMSDGRLTLEAPTRCISNTDQRHWSLLEPPLLALSPDTIRFFQSAPTREVLPGPSNSPFGNRRASPTECEDARANLAARTEADWRLALRRMKSLFSFGSAFAQGNEPEPSNPPTATISVHAQPAAYPLGYPIAVRVIVDNTGDEPLPVIGRLNPGYGMLMVEYRRRGESEWSMLQPLNWYEPTSDEQAMLALGARTEETIPVYFGEDGWTFGEPGAYELRVRLQSHKATPDIVSEPISLRIEAPRTDEDRNAVQPLLDPDGRLANKAGRLLSFGGRIGEPEDMEPLEQSAEQYGHTAIGGALRLTLLSQRLRRPIDPDTGLRPPPDYDDARELLEDTCTDSGVAAMTSELLEQRASTLPASLRSRAVTDAAAWDGVSPANSVVRTYTDKTLQSWGPTLHFCYDEARLRGPARAALPNLARQLQRERPARVVVIGHSDQSGTCRYNETLALQRADTVRKALVAGGLHRSPIEIVSLGERRPVDFAAADAAQELNRRVEILIEGVAGREEAAERQRLLSQCPTRRQSLPR